MSVNQRKNLSYGITQPLVDQAPMPIRSDRAPGGFDRAEVGTIWIDMPNNDSYILKKSKYLFMNITLTCF